MDSLTILQTKEQEKLDLFRRRCQFRLRINTIRSHNKVNKRKLWLKTGKKCAIQGCDVTTLKELTLDHIVPIALAVRLGWHDGDISAQSNLQLLCEKHHQKKDKGVHHRVAQLDREASVTK